MSRRLSTAEFPDLLPGSSAVTGEAGTVSGQSGQPARRKAKPQASTLHQ